MKLGIVGNGVVGSATAGAWTEFADVKVWDLDTNKRTHERYDVLHADVVFVCLPTPAGEDGTLDTHALDAFFSDLPEEARRTTYAIRSTLNVGDTDALQQRHRLPKLLHFPEFLTARTARVDAMCPSRHVVGTAMESTGGTQCILGDALRKRFPGVHTYFMSARESEFVKLMQNAFFATKIAFFNEACNKAEEAHVRWPNVLEAVLADGRIAHSHTQVPGPDGKRGFGGTCLPKDLAAFAQIGHSLAYVAEAALLRNNVKDRT